MHSIHYRLGLTGPFEFVEDVEELRRSIEMKLEALHGNTERRYMRYVTTLKKQLEELECLPTTGSLKKKQVHSSPPYQSEVKRMHVPHQDQLEEAIKDCTEITMTEEEEADVDPPQPLAGDICQHCNVPLKVSQKKGILVCDQCGYSETYMDMTVNALPYNTALDMTSFSYNRINHFNEWLLQIQGREGTTVPATVIEQVKNAFKKHRIVDPTKMTPQKVREILKELKLNKYYYHVTQIASLVSGIEQPHLTSAIEEKCRLMFIAIQSPFEDHCPADRKNFLSYPFCLFKFLQLLGCHEMLKGFILLKGRDKLRKQDEIFEKICHSLNWEFIPSC